MFTQFIFYLSFVTCPFNKFIYPNINTKRASFPILENNYTLMEQSLEPPSGGELKLMTHLSAENWAHNWILYIANSDIEYDDHYYLDYFTMKGMANMYTSSDYFYLGFFPESIITNQGPKYIGLFKLEHKSRIFSTKCIIENPYYMEGDSELDIFKDYLIALTESAFVFFKYTELNTPGQVRYYLEWKFK